MKDRMERFIALPFSIGCVSQSSVAVGESQTKKAPAEPLPAQPFGEDESQYGSTGQTKSSFALSPLPRPNISAGFQKLIKGFKNLSQLFVMYKDEDEEVEMEIGLPTDVQHVAHIGWDGFNNVGAMKSWDRAQDLLPLPSLSLRQFELAMSAQADGPLSCSGPIVA